MTMTYQQQFVLDGLAGRAAILNLNARHDRTYSTGDIGGWIATFRHSGATFARAGHALPDLQSAFDGGDGKRMVTVDHDITVDGVDATQRCVVLVFADNALLQTGAYLDKLVYERGGWYFASRELDWDHVPQDSALPV